jgi:hypothetical protein
MEFKVVDKERDYKLLTSWDAVMASEVPLMPHMSDEEWQRTNKRLREMAVISPEPFTENVATLIPMAWYEEILVVSWTFGFLGFLLLGPFGLLYLLLYHRGTFALLCAVVLALHTLIPNRLRPTVCRGYMAKLALKYFSHRGIWKENLPQDRPSIIVAPPHGVFPFGSLLACISVPRIVGLYIRGLAADALLNIPLIGTRMKALGLVSASKHVAKKMLLDGWSLGVSSGGIAEIFETWSTKDGKPKVEVIILKSRGGLCKLALETGAYLVPSYIFGNTQCLKVWTDPFGIMQRVSRSLRVSICFFSGRFGLPIPNRVPLLGVLGSPIIVPKTGNPTQEQVAALLAKLESEIKALFDTHKGAYGWTDVNLIIK